MKRISKNVRIKTIIISNIVQEDKVFISVNSGFKKGLKKNI